MEERVEIAGMWEVGWNYPLMEHTQWEMVLREFGISHMNMAPISGIEGKFLREYASLEEIIESSELEPVFVDEEGEVELSEFEHPRNALYVLGRVSYSSFTQCGKGYKSVRINTPNRGMLWPHQALAIVLYDRVRKK